MHVGAVEQGIALADHRDEPSGIEMRRKAHGGAVVKRAQRVAIDASRARHLTRHWIIERQLLDARLEVICRDRTRVARVAVLGEMHHEIGFAQRPHRFQGHELRIARPHTDA
jgi:hypothetical protein